MTEEELFVKALAIESKQDRAAFLVNACGDDMALRDRVEALLASYDSAEEFLETVPDELDELLQSPELNAASPSPMAPEDAALKEGASIGSYRLLEVIGDGGMGIVYRAQQTEPVRRQVAVKVIKPGMDSRRVLARFDAERQALAMMNHPNVAAIHDAGVTDGMRPYFVMELVKGFPITEFCDGNQLSARERLELFIPVCQAIQHAHQKGIIHRDIKPSNVLVACYDDKPVPKVIDFGIAKALGPEFETDAPITMFGAVIGTLQYMSPEQATFNALDVDTRTDVYALGALLYELLTGSPPLKESLSEKAAIQTLLDLIRDEEPPRPSTRISRSGDALPTLASRRASDPDALSRGLRGELDLIIMKAIQKDRTQRYESAGNFARDIERYLAGDAVEACPPTWRYRTRKFLRKNRGAVVAVSLVFLTLVAGIIGTGWGLARATDGEEFAFRMLNIAESSKEEAEKERTKALKSLADANTQRAIAEKLFKEQLRARKAAEAATELAHQSDYAHRIALADKEIKVGNINRAHALLSGCPEEFRHFEWYRLWHTLDLSVATYRTFNSPINSAVISADGKRIVAGSADGAVRIWDVATSRVTHTFLAHPNGVNDVAISSDGLRIASCGNDKMVKLWDAARPAKPLHVFKGHSLNPSSVAINGDGTRIASGSNGLFIGDAFVWTAEDGSPGEKLQKTKAPPMGLAISNDGNLVVISHFSGVQVWDKRRGVEPVVQFSTEDVTNHAVALSPDGTRLVVGAGAVMQYRDLQQEGAILGAWFGHADHVYSTVLSKDGKRIVSAGHDQTIKVWDTEKPGPPVLTLHGHGNAVKKISISADRTQIVSSSADGTAKRWTSQGVTKSKQVLPVGENDAKCVTISPDGRLLATGNKDKTITLWDIQKHAPIRTLQVDQGTLNHLAFSANGDRLASAGYKTIKIWDTTTWNLIHTLAGHRSTVATLAWSDDGQWIASGGQYGNIMLWDARKGGTAVQAFKGHEKRVNTVAINRNGSRIVSGSFDKTLKFWNANNVETPVFTSPEINQYVKSVDLHPYGQVVIAACGDGTIKFFAPNADNQPFAELRGHTSAVNSAVFSRDGKRIFSSSGDKTVKVWDAVNKGDALLTLAGHAARLDAVFVSHDAKRLISNGRDGSVVIWNANYLPSGNSN